MYISFVYINLYILSSKQSVSIVLNMFIHFFVQYKSKYLTFIVRKILHIYYIKHLMIMNKFGICFHSIVDGASICIYRSNDYKYTDELKPKDQSKFIQAKHQFQFKSKGIAIMLHLAKKY